MRLYGASNRLIRLVILLLYVVFCEEILGPSHRLELQVVPARVLEEHRPLLPRHPLEPKCRLDDELDVGGPQALHESVELGQGQRQPRVGNWHLVTVNGVVIILAAVIIPHPMSYNLVAVEGVILPLLAAPALDAAKDTAVELLGKSKVVNGEGHVERTAGCGMSEGLVGSCSRIITARGSATKGDERSRCLCVCARKQRERIAPKWSH